MRTLKTSLLLLPLIASTAWAAGPGELASPSAQRPAAASRSSGLEGQDRPQDQDRAQARKTTPRTSCCWWEPNICFDGETSSFDTCGGSLHCGTCA